MRVAAGVSSLSGPGWGSTVGGGEFVVFVGGLIVRAWHGFTVVQHGGVGSEQVRAAPKVLWLVTTFREAGDPFDLVTHPCRPPDAPPTRKSEVTRRWVPLAGRFPSV